MATTCLASYPVRESFSGYQAPVLAAQSQRSTLNLFSNRVMAPPTSDHGPVPQPRPSAPPTDEGTRMSLPSISNLLGIADANRPDTSQVQEQRTQYHEASQTKRARYDRSYDQRRPDVDLSHSHQHGQQSNGNHSRAPSTYAQYSPVTGNAQPAYTTEKDQARVAAEGLKRRSLQSTTYETSPYSGKPFGTSPDTASDGSVYSPTSTMHRQIGIYGGAQTIPTSYPQPTVSTTSHASPNVPAASPWEHHHYIGTSAQQGMYPPLPDRYICQTCNKAFSRPSSLKIHSHSHTGEKPFKCPHAGCGKAFSVKSNMKRHEKGCHTAGGVPAGAYLQDDA